MPRVTLEYLRRNLNVAQAIGANANAKAALQRLKAHKRPPLWLLEYLEGIVSRTERLGHELAKYRDQIPVHLQPCVPGCYCTPHDKQHSEGRSDG